MATPLKITSPKNDRVKDALQLEKPRERAARGECVVEGAREIERALKSGFRPKAVFSRETRHLSTAGAGVLAEIGRRSDIQWYEVSDEVFEKLAVRENSDGLVVIFKTEKRNLDSLSPRGVPLILAVEGVEKPGNLGALLRSADGAGADALVVLDGAVDAFNANVIRASLGTVFHVPVINASSDEFLAFCRMRGIAIVGAALAGHTKEHVTQNFTGACAILLGSEAEGLSESWLKKADALVKIPMLGIADSLNVAAAGAVLMYEARRQRS